ncbi:hypothetical protein RclHR1_06890006 [Rhizophagus clarus]|uniref:TLDc domain-containing protein n=1 Tax=Rhizophagus clarus TaxID=94130 RepID=A0A2Z6SBB5_9GLOM|nr:hypothetical protein RclHR1_06890006 [Rhizophagus clarus]
MSENIYYYNFNAEIILKLNLSSLIGPSDKKNFITNVKKKNNDRILAHIKLPNILPEIFQIILRYIYWGRFSLEKYDDSDIIRILVAANEFGLQELNIHLQTFLIENKKNWMNQNFNLIYQTSFKNDSFLKLQDFCKEMMSKELEKIFNSIDFNSISEKCLISLIQHENSQKNIIQVWKHVLKWGIAQNPELPSDPSNYFKDDFNTLKNTLHHCIPFIKFYNLTSKEFVEKVYPFKKVIPKELREKLIKDFIYRPIKKPEQKMIKEISSKNEIKNPYEFKLILRGSRDGFSPSKFHEIRDNQSHTISIIKMKYSDEILGGYNPDIWKSDKSWGAPKDGFMFSFMNKDNIKDYILIRVTRGKFATYNDVDCGPAFTVVLF